MTDNDKLLAGKHCLVLDDEFLIALDIEQILKAAGAASVISVSTAAAALAALDERRFDLAVLDVKLSDAAGNSMSLAAVLTERNVAVVFVTGLRRDHAQIRRFPAVQVVEKPYQEPVLLEALRRTLTRH